MAELGRRSPERHFVLQSRLTHYLRFRREDATDSATTSVERLALVRDRMARIREVRREPEGNAVADSTGQRSVGANQQPVVNARCERAKEVKGWEFGRQFPPQEGISRVPEVASPPTVMGTKRLVGFFADTHGLLRPEAIQALQGVERIIHAGDLDMPAVLQGLRALAPVTAVRGNVDTGEWAKGLPKTVALAIDQVRVCVIHNLKDLDIVPEVAGFQVVVCGHTHRPSIQERNGVLYVNPGSAGPRRFRSPVSLALMEVQGHIPDVKLVPLES